MRPSLRFLALAVAGWAGVRAATLGVLPSASFLKIAPSAARTPPIIPTQFAAVDPVAVPPAAQQPYPVAAPYPPQVQPVMVPVYYPAQVSRPVTDGQHSSRPSYYPANQGLGGWSLAGLAGVSSPVRSSSTPVPREPAPLPPPPEPPIQPRIDRLQLTTWAMLRNQQTGVAGSRSLAPAGQLGASQAGMRLFYNFNRQLALTARTSTPVGQRGGEVAAGVRAQPLASIPIWLTAERRQRIGRFGGGRNAFALFLEGGLYQRPLPGHFDLDAYFQGGVVGVKSRDLFVDGGMTVTRHIFSKYSAGFGIWGGAQPGLSRLDAGPRVTIKVRKNVKVHLDWRQKLAGNAKPDSGPALTLAGDF
ncbi:MAG: hypothetical protein ACTHKE_12805 [Sphingomicrobium sp.]